MKNTYKHKHKRKCKCKYKYTNITIHIGIGIRIKCIIILGATKVQYSVKAIKGPVLIVIRNT